MSVADSVRAWFRLFRAHTAILEAPLAILGASLALGTLWKPVIVLWGIFGIIYHFVGYGMNSYVDWKKGFDKDDPRKQHHPLNTGEITPSQAKKAIMFSLVLLIVYGLVIAGFSTVAFASVGIMLVSGVSYNYFGKYTRLKFLPISLVHTMVFIFPFIHYQKSLTLSDNNLHLLFVLMAVGYFIHHIFQIAISGDVKDIDQDEASLIQDLGTTLRVNGMDKCWFDVSTPVLVLSYFLMTAQVSFAAASSLMIGGADASIFVIALLGLWMTYEGDKVVQAGMFHREQRVIHMSRKELAGYLMIHAAAIPIIGYKAFGVLAVFIFGYLFIVSKFMWGNWLKPEV